MNRRSFLRTAGYATAAVPLVAFLERQLGAVSDRFTSRPLAKGYGALAPVNDPTTGLSLLRLPDGFTYVSFGWTGDRLINGRPTPPLHDGMGAFAVGPSRVRLVRNHELGPGSPFSEVAYDGGAAGGTTTVEFDTKEGAFVSAFDSLSGTLRNCAGGVTPWGSWLTCEETTTYAGRPHGYVFEVPADGKASTKPLRDMGRFSHEAVAVDPSTGYIYETEDAGRRSGFYRFVPHTRTDLSRGGRLSMMRLRGRPHADLGASHANGTTFDVEWVSIPTPDNPLPSSPSDFVWSQGRAGGAATFARLEGCWYGNDARVYVVSTSGGRGFGQVWEYHPAAETIRLLIESPSAAVLNKPDNIAVSPRGGLVVCEDSGTGDRLHGLTVDGQLFTFAEHRVVLAGEKNGLSGDFTGSEWAGACYSPDGQWLFANIQNPGVTVAITGPWGSGAL